MPEWSMAPPPTATDKVEQARWFAEEIQPHEPKLRGWLRARFPSLRDIDDLVQESYVRLIRARETGKVVNPKAYLFATARNAALLRRVGLNGESVPDAARAEN